MACRSWRHAVMASSYWSKTMALSSTILIATATPIATAAVTGVLIGSRRLPSCASGMNGCSRRAGCWVQRPRWWTWLCCPLCASFAIAIQPPLMRSQVCSPYSVGWTNSSIRLSWRQFWSRHGPRASAGSTNEVSAPTVWTAGRLRPANAACLARARGNVACRACPRRQLEAGAARP